MTNQQEKELITAIEALLTDRYSTYCSELLEGPAERISPSAYAIVAPVRDGEQLVLWGCIVTYNEQEHEMPSSTELRKKILGYRLRSEVRVGQAEFEREFEIENEDSQEFHRLALEAWSRRLPVIMVIFGIVESGQFRGRLVAHLVHSREMPFAYGLDKFQELIFQHYYLSPPG